MLSFALTSEFKLVVSENEVKGKMFGPTTEVIVAWEKIRNKEFRNLLC